MSTDPPAPFFGQFAAIRALNLPRTRVGDIYEGANTAVYDRLLGADEYDVPAYLGLAEKHPGRILELACGSGRIAMPLARAGHEVVGVDLAPDMLARLRHRLSTDEELASRVTVVEGDMTAPDVEGPFGLVIIAATSVCLLHDRADRRRAFASARDLLAPDGRFVLDHVATSPGILRAQSAEPVTAGGPVGARTVFTILGRLWDPEANVQHVNFYTEIVDPEGGTDRILGSTTKAVVDNAELREDLEASGLAVEDETVLSSVPHGEEVEEIRLLTCRRA
ncbi:daptide-type RiPP biosynthesis methyltransferase [Patulibacter sp.]|uniref:daptide-type RiPP biosynthesis methyltransferase n=1 Tax=Patulibacter sp. TaxID=1912859 RepID=UPI00271636A2|nr:daptide-type RiPP biosynthesis methyltransferase [Patulibacter sp.]MDO9410720.1 daptide-type RiPP biosynthesis methyltransferase [Patulibacter sp.]